MFQHILVPLDGSDESEEALAAASSIAEAYGGARITLLAVMLRFPESKLHVARMDDQSEARGEDYLTKVIDDHRFTFPVGLKVRLGVPADEILDEAKAGVDLIVMSTHGTSASVRDRHSIGSTAWRVLHDAPCPVMLIPIRRDQ